MEEEDVFGHQREGIHEIDCWSTKYINAAASSETSAERLYVNAAASGETHARACKVSLLAMQERLVLLNHVYDFHIAAMSILPGVSAVAIGSKQIGSLPIRRKENGCRPRSRSHGLERICLGVRQAWNENMHEPEVPDNS
eukprot:6650767-Pyramimonas_sp.AAC.1